MVRFASFDNGPQPGGEWLVVGFRPEDAAGGSREIDSMTAVAAEDVSHIAVVNPELERLLPDWAPRLLEELPAGTASVSVLLALRACPWPEARSDGRIYSFIATADVFRRVLQLAPDVRPWHLCFQLLHAALNGTLPLDKLIIRQLPYPELPPPPPELPPTSVIMPHRGNPQYLRTALSFVDRLDGARLQTLIGLDMDDPAEYRTLSEEYTKASFFRIQPAPSGPYVIRQELALRASREFLMLHDSDDVSCSDRLTTLHAEMHASNSDFVGSHELRVDELSGEIFAIRFPLDVVAALRERPGHALLHPTGMIRREGYFHTGGLSTDQFIANDTQFLFRTFFYLKIRNANAFLYIRRRHPDALTVAPATANGIPLRIELDRQWRADFERIKQGQLALEHSSLRPMTGIKEHRLVAL